MASRDFPGRVLPLMDWLLLDQATQRLRKQSDQLRQLELLSDLNVPSNTARLSQIETPMRTILNKNGGLGD